MTWEEFEAAQDKLLEEYNAAMEATCEEYDQATDPYEYQKNKTELGNQFW